MHWNLSSSSWFYKRFAILVHCKFFFFGLASIPVAVGLFLLFFSFCSTLLSYGKIDHLERTVGLLLRFALFFFFFFILHCLPSTLFSFSFSLFDVCKKTCKILQKQTKMLSICDEQCRAHPLKWTCMLWKCVCYF